MNQNVIPSIMSKQPHACIILTLYLAGKVRLKGLRFGEVRALLLGGDDVQRFSQDNLLDGEFREVRRDFIQMRKNGWIPALDTKGNYLSMTALFNHLDRMRKWGLVKRKSMMYSLRQGVFTDLVHQSRQSNVIQHLSRSSNITMLPMDVLSIDDVAGELTRHMNLRKREVEAGILDFRACVLYWGSDLRTTFPLFFSNDEVPEPLIEAAYGKKWIESYRRYLRMKNHASALTPEQSAALIKMTITRK